MAVIAGNDMIDVELPKPFYESQFEKEVEGGHIKQLADFVRWLTTEKPTKEEEVEIVSLFAFEND